MWYASPSGGHWLPESFSRLMLSSYFSLVMLGAAVKRARTRVSDVVGAMVMRLLRMEVLLTQPSFCEPNEESESEDRSSTLPLSNARLAMSAPESPMRNPVIPITAMAPSRSARIARKRVARASRYASNQEPAPQPS